MTDYNTFLAKAIINSMMMSERLRRQSGQIRTLKARNDELNILVGYLKEKVLEYDPSMKERFESLNI